MISDARIPAEALFFLRSGQPLPVTVAFDGALQIRDVDARQLAGLKDWVYGAVPVDGQAGTNRAIRSYTARARHHLELTEPAECLRWLVLLQQHGAIGGAAEFREFLDQIPPVRDPRRIPFLMANLGNAAIMAKARRTPGDAWEWHSTAAARQEANQMLVNLSPDGKVRHLAPARFQSLRPSRAALDRWGIPRDETLRRRS